MKKYTFCNDTEESLRMHYPGWADFILSKFDDIQKHIDENKLKLNLYTKEKYGHYDITVNGATDDYVRDIINAIETKTPYLCIDTGEELEEMYGGENRRDLGRVLPRCDKCFGQLLKNRNDLKNLQIQGGEIPPVISE